MMTITRYFNKLAMSGAFLLTVAESARSAPITYNTNASGTGFGGTSLTLTSTIGAEATLTFIPNANGDTGVPSNLNYGTFRLRCTLCSAQGLGSGAFFDPFMFNLIITDLTDGAIGRFVGFSAGGTVYSNVSPITLDWAPLELGPGTNNASSGSFGPNVFQITPTTRIVAPNSGQLPGQTTVQGEIFGANDFPIVAEVPEPATLFSITLGLMALGMLGRRRLAREIEARG